MNNPRSDFETQAVIKLMNRMLELREPGDHEGLGSEGNGDSVPVASELFGNLGNLVFLHGGTAYGEGWIASSLKSKYELADYFKRIEVKPVQLSATKCGTPFWKSLDDPDSVHIFQPRYKTAIKKSHDSEYLLINFLAEAMSEMKVNEGTLYLLTERIPCAHCTRVIKQFKEDFSRVEVCVMYFLNTQTTDKNGKVKVRTSANFREETQGICVNLLHTKYGNGRFTTTTLVGRS